MDTETTLNSSAASAEDTDGPSPTSGASASDVPDETKIEIAEEEPEHCIICLTEDAPEKRIYKATCCAAYYHQECFNDNMKFFFEQPAHIPCAHCGKTHPTSKALELEKITKIPSICITDWCYAIRYKIRVKMLTRKNYKCKSWSA